MLADLDLQTEYRTGESDLAECFYRPCLAESERYDRAVGYFRSSIAAVYGQAVISFARRGGRIRLVCSTDLPPEDAAAGSTPVEATASAQLLAELQSLLSNSECADRVAVVATLVALGVLEIQVAIPRVGVGIFHEKLGIFRDTAGNALSFKGSSNETWSGWHPLGNVESNEIFRSWASSEEASRVRRHLEYFDRLWRGEVAGLDVIPLPDAVRRELIKHSKQSLDDIDQPPPGDVGSDKRFQIRRHQSSALQSWRAAGRRGILEHATGSGKTITALLAIKEHSSSGGPTLVLVPSEILLWQWQSETKKMLPNAVVLLAGAGNSGWREGTRLRTMTRASDVDLPRIVIATMQTARTEAFRSALGGGDQLLVVADEVHQIGAPENSQCMSISSGPRLGLSATPQRYGDPDGTSKILDYFGPVIQPPFTLRDAIDAGVLCEYEYFPHVAHLSPTEADEWRARSLEIAREVARTQESNSPFRLSERARMLLIRRARIAKKAESKIRLAANTIMRNYRHGQRWLVYCDDIEQLNQVHAVIRAQIPETSEYHSKMTADRDATLQWFNNSGGVLVSIGCLDEGVDIPSASHALILASSQNPRQFIQRRGRVLRKADGKLFATIHDAIVAPQSIETEPTQTALLHAELARALAFARDAINPSATTEIRSIAVNAGIDPNTLLTVGIEEES